MTLICLYAFNIVYVLVTAAKLFPKLSDERMEVFAGAQSHIRVSLKSTGRVRPAFQRVRVTIKATNVFTGERTVKTMTITSEGSLTAEAEQDFTSKLCGVLVFEITRAVCCDLIGVFSRRVPQKNIGTPVTIFVRPQLFDADTSIFKGTSMRISAPVYSKTRGGDEPPDVFDYREYNEGDSAKHISVKLSARYDELIVKQFSLPEASCLTLLYFASANASPQVLNTLVSITASFAMRAAASSDGVKLFYYDRADNVLNGQFIASSAGVLEQLSAFCAMPRSDNFEIDISAAVAAASPSVLCCVTDSISAEAAAAIKDIKIPTVIIVVDSHPNVPHPTGITAVTPENAVKLLGGEM